LLYFDCRYQFKVYHSIRTKLAYKSTEGCAGHAAEANTALAKPKSFALRRDENKKAPKGALGIPPRETQR
jgi:hypothetical protein